MDKETSFLQNPSLEGEENDDLNQGHASKQVHKFYFVNLRPTDPDSVSRIRKAERAIQEMNQEHLQISEKIKEKVVCRCWCSFMVVIVFFGSN